MENTLNLTGTSSMSSTSEELFKLIAKERIKLRKLKISIMVLENAFSEEQKKLSGIKLDAASVDEDLNAVEKYVSELLRTNYAFAKHNSALKEALRDTRIALSSLNSEHPMAKAGTPRSPGTD